MKKTKTGVVLLLTVMAILALSGCGMNKTKKSDDTETTTGWSVENPDNTTQNNDTGNFMDRLGAGTFDTYEDAKNYLKDKLETDNEGIEYEFREESEDLTAYDSANPGAEGYQFHVYESDGGKKTGDYYVDKDTGKIYLYTKENKIKEY